MKEHERNIHGSENVCDQYNETFKNEEKNKEFRKIIQKAGCDRCDKQCENIEKLKMHLKKEHRISNICEYCDRSLRKEKELEKHIKNIHTEEIKCSDCNKKFRNIYK